MRRSRFTWSLWKRREQTPRIGVCSLGVLPARFGPSTTRRSTAESALSAAAAKSSATAGALRLWPRFADVEATPAELMRIQFVNGSLRLFVRTHFDESESARLPRCPITHHRDALHGSDRGKQILQFWFFRLERQISDVQLFTH